MLRKSSIYFLYILLAVLLVVIAFRCKSSEQESNTTENTSPWLNLHDSAKYVGMQTCRNCHEDIYQSYRQTGMGQSFGLATKEKSAANFNHFPIYDSFNNLYYKPFWQNSTLFINEFRLLQTDTLHSRTEKIDYIIGSGHHTNSHLFSENGYLYQAPFTWYVQQQKLDLPPGYEAGFNSRFSRVLESECITCHNGYPKLAEGSVNKYHQMPQGIDCERCHGPGSIHVQEKILGNFVDIKHDTDFTIVNPRKLPYDLQIDVCQRCHLQGNAVLKDGKTFYDFKPGMRLRDVMDVFMPVYENADGSFLMAAHAERLQKSACFLQTEKSTHNLNCISCHNPHQGVKNTKIEYFISKCKSCHTGAQDDCKEQMTKRLEVDNNCISCHMPRTSTVDIPHVTITDHFIRVVKKEDLNLDSKTVKFHGLKSYNNPNPEKITKAKAFIYFYEKFQHQDFMLDSAWNYLQQYSPEKQTSTYILYYYVKGNYAEVTKIAEKYGNKITEPLTLYQIGQSYLNTSTLTSAINFLEKAVAAQPLNLNYRIIFASALLQAKELEKAKEQLHFVIKENSKLASAWSNLAFAEMADGNLLIAKQHIGKALKLDPDYLPAYINRAKLWLNDNEITKAKRDLEIVLSKDRNNKDAILLLQLINQHY